MGTGHVVEKLDKSVASVASEEILNVTSNHAESDDHNESYAMSARVLGLFWYTLHTHCTVNRHCPDHCPWKGETSILKLLRHLFKISYATDLTRI